MILAPTWAAALAIDPKTFRESKRREGAPPFERKQKGAPFFWRGRSQSLSVQSGPVSQESGMSTHDTAMPRVTDQPCEAVLRRLKRKNRTIFFEQTSTSFSGLGSSAVEPRGSQDLSQARGLLIHVPFFHYICVFPSYVRLISTGVQRSRFRSLPGLIVMAVYSYRILCTGESCARFQGCGLSSMCPLGILICPLGAPAGPGALHREEKTGTAEAQDRTGKP